MDLLEIQRDLQKEIRILNGRIKIFNDERKKIKIDFPKDHVVPRTEVLKNLEKFKDEGYIAWIGHATFLIKLGNYTNS